MATTTVRLTGYTAEMDRIHSEISELAENALAPPLDTERATKYLSYLYQRASLAGDLEALPAVEAAIDRAIPHLPNPGDLYLLKANLAMKVHRLDKVAAALASSPEASGSVEGVALRADVDFQLGRYEAAKRGYEEALRLERRWDTLARLAHFAGKFDGAETADRIYEEAEDELTAKEMRSYAWLEVQRGLLDFFAGRFDEADGHYRQAAAAYPGYWFVDEHRAESLGAQARFAEAAGLLEEVVRIAPKPELWQALGELYALMGAPERASSWNERALSSYLRSADRGEVHYFHHLTDFYSDVAEDGEKAEEFARKDIALRENFDTQTALAWALFRSGAYEEATAWIERAMASGATAARMQYLAAQIYSAAGKESESRHLLERAQNLNPKIGGFHIHH